MPPKATDCCAAAKCRDKPIATLRIAAIRDHGYVALEHTAAGRHLKSPYRYAENIIG
jgi:hypothetical protein